MSELIRREDAIKATWKEPSYADPLNVLTEVRDRINALPAASPWHRAEEEPIEYQRCMVYSSETGQMVSGVWTEFGWMIPGPIGKLTHWMPIEPPKEGTHENRDYP